VTDDNAKSCFAPPWNHGRRCDRRLCSRRRCAGSLCRTHRTRTDLEKDAVDLNRPITSTPSPGDRARSAQSSDTAVMAPALSGIARHSPTESSPKQTATDRASEGHSGAEHHFRRSERRPSHGCRSLRTQGTHTPRLNVLESAIRRPSHNHRRGGYGTRSLGRRLVCGIGDLRRGSDRAGSIFGEVRRRTCGLLRGPTRSPKRPQRINSGRRLADRSAMGQQHARPLSGESCGAAEGIDITVSCG